MAMAAHFYPEGSGYVIEMAYGLAPDHSPKITLARNGLARKRETVTAMIAPHIWSVAAQDEEQLLCGGRLSHSRRERYLRAKKMKNWADHCSSDDEEDVIERQELLEQHEDAAAPVEEPPLDETPPAPKAPKQYDFPSGPPFTAFIGNLAYSIIEPTQLAEEMTALAKQKLDLDIDVSDPRILMDHKSEKPRHRGFGYIQVASLDQLKALMQLNECDAMLAGRRLQLDTANQSPRRSSQGSTAGAIDGSRFRGGKFARSAVQEGGGGGGGPPAQRTSLKLKPRSKPVEESRPSQSNIFGSGSARDEKSWQERRKSETDDQPRRHSNKGGGRGRGGGGGGGRGGGGGGGGRGGGGGGGSRGGGGRGHKDDRRASGRGSVKEDKAKAAATSAAATTAPAPAPAPVPPKEPEKPAAKEPKVVNKFAALDFDSDSD